MIRSYILIIDRTGLFIVFSSIRLLIKDTNFFFFIICVLTSLSDFAQAGVIIYNITDTAQLLWANFVYNEILHLASRCNLAMIPS